MVSSCDETDGLWHNVIVCQVLIGLKCITRYGRLGMTSRLVNSPRCGGFGGLGTEVLQFVTSGGDLCHTAEINDDDDDDGRVA